MGTYIIYDIDTGENVHRYLARRYHVEIPEFFCSRKEAEIVIDKLDLPFWKYSIALDFTHTNPNYKGE